MTDTSMVPRKRDGDRPASLPLVDEQLADQLLGKAQAEGVELLGPAACCPSVRGTGGRSACLAGVLQRPDRRVSRRGESHPPPLSGPDVTVSRHPAPTVRPAVNAMSCQWANRRGWY
jgi:hypothetical protein